MKFAPSATYIYMMAFICSLWTTVSCLYAQVQTAPDRYRIDFTDKNHNQYTISRPQEFLSERALQRRARQGIAVTHADLPVSACYIDSLKQMDFEVLNSSRWFNSATVRCSPDELEKLAGVGFIKHTSVVQKEIVQDTTRNEEIDLGRFFSFLFGKKEDANAISKYAATPAYYGEAAVQAGMMNGQALHNRGFRGKGMLIAVIDGGFYKINELSGFDHLRQTGRLREIKNFTPDTIDILGDNSHGSNVLSIIASNLPGRMMGSAPDADYVLLRSEETGSEYLVELDNWIAAVEYADSIGVDVITSSLGYTTFDDVSQNHRHDELDGRTVRASRAASMAAARGMIVCASAGNDGDSRWKQISIPADADSIITVGAVDREGRYVSFSSVGHTADRRIKPDLTAMGEGTAYQNSAGNIHTGNGTSYSTPLVAGFVACLWQAFPDKGNMEIMDMVKRSASHFHAPDSLYGYGIPDFSNFVEPASLPYAVSVLTEPATGTWTLFLSPARHGRVRIRIKNIGGKRVFSHKGNVAGYDIYELPVDKSADFAAGIYTVKLRTNAGKMTVKAVK